MSFWSVVTATTASHAKAPTPAAQTWAARTPPSAASAPAHGDPHAPAAGPR
jgi:hypothetical protein